MEKYYNCSFRVFIYLYKCTYKFDMRLKISKSLLIFLFFFPRFIFFLEYIILLLFVYTLLYITLLDFVCFVDEKMENESLLYKVFGVNFNDKLSVVVGK